VGIGNTHPTAMLDVNGNLNIGGTSILNSRVGIGTTNPSQMLDVNGNVNIGGSAIIGSRLGIGTTNPLAALDIAGSASISANLTLNGRDTFINQLGGGNIHFQTSVGGDTGLAAKMTILNNGNVGIGTTKPNSTLQVVGSITFSNFTNNGGLLYTNGSGVLTQTSGGMSGQCLVTSGTTPFWTPCTSALGFSNPMIAPGDLIVGGSASFFNWAIPSQGASASVIDTWSGNASYIIDSNDSTIWSSSTHFGSNPWFKIDLGQAREISFFRMKQEIGSDCHAATTFQIESSNDSSNWSLQYTSPTGQGGDTGTIKLPIKTTARYWKVTGTSGSSSCGWTVYSFELIQGEEAGHMTRLAAGAPNQILMSTGSEVKWNNLTNINLDNYDFYFYGSGNVGIGTTTPTEKLEINGGLKIFDSAIGRGDLYTTAPLNKTWTANADFNNAGAAFSSGLENPATNNELKLKTDANNSPLSGWSFFKPITITNSTTDLTDYQILVTLDTASLILNGKMQSNCNDIRFTDSDKTTLLSYWLESGCNTTSTRFWVKVPSIPASSSKTIYVYYGNPSATGISNGSATFDFFDDFSTDTSANYVALGGAVKSYDSTNQVLKQTNTGTGQYWLVSSILSLPTKYVYSADVKVVNDVQNRKHAGILTDALTSAQTGYRLTHLDTNYLTDKFSAGSSTSIGSFADGGVYANNAWVSHTVYRDRSSGLLNYKATYNGTTVSGAYTNTAYTTGSIGLFSYGAEVWYDNLRVRKYASPEPTIGVGTEAAGYSSGEQTWTSETIDAGAGKTLQPNKFTATWILDGSDNIAPKFQILGSDTGAFGGEETVYPSASEYYQDGTTYDLNSGEEKDISGEIKTAYRYWKVKAYLDTGSTLTDTPRILDIGLKDYRPSISLAGNGQKVGIGTNSPASRLEVVDYQLSQAAAAISSLNVGANTSVLALKVGSTAPDITNSFVTFLNGNGEVIGKITGNGSGGVTYSTSGSDFAEYFRKAAEEETFEPGEVVCLNTLGLVTKCDSVNTQMIGVVSGHAGFAGNGNYANDPKYVLVGLLGQLEVKVSTESGEINPGDTLTSSTTPGVAIKAEKNGQILGRALEAFTASESGKIKAFVHVSYEQVLADALTSSIKATPLSSSSSDIQVEGNLIVSGKTTLADTSITGNLTAGLVIVNGLEGSISSLGKNLKLQNGTVMIDLQGNITAEGEITAKKINIQGEIVSASLGESILKAGASQIMIKTSAVTEKSQIFITPQTKTDLPLAVTQKTPGVSFTVETETPATKDIKFSWWIIN